MAEMTSQAGGLDIDNGLMTADCHFSSDSGAVIDVAEIPTLGIGKPTIEMLDKLTVKDLLGVIDSLELRGILRSARKPQFIDAFLRAWDGVIMRDVSASSTTAQQEQTKCEGHPEMAEHMIANPPTVIEMDRTGKVVSYGAMGSETSAPQAPQEPEPEEVMPETWTEHDETTLKFLNAMKDKGMNLDGDVRVKMEEKKKATDPTFYSSAI